MTNQVWRPLGVDTEEEVAEYDALHDGVPEWMSAAYWGWVQRTITYYKQPPYSLDRNPWPEPELIETMCQRLKIALPNIRSNSAEFYLGSETMNKVMDRLLDHHSPVQIADYLLAHSDNADADELDTILKNSKSAWKVGTRNGWAGLERRVPEGVQIAADDVMYRSGRAGIRLAKAWEQLYGIAPDPSGAYRSAILAVEDAAIPVVSPKDGSATLGKILGQIERDTKWRLPMEREHGKAPSREVLVGMMRLLWHGQHDRHGGQNKELEGEPSAPGNVSQEEAAVAVSLAVTIVNLFHTGLVAGEPRA